MWRLAAAILLVASEAVPAAAFVDVLTHRNSNNRTGANLEETILKPGNVNALHFGKLFTLHVTGQIYAQPLIVTNIEIQGKPRNVVYVATMENWVYAFDADGGNQDPDTGAREPYWSRSLGPPLPVNRIPKDIGAALGKYNIEPYVGITSTPVIDRDAGAMFLVAKIAKIGPVEVDCEKQPANKECPVENRIFALDLKTGATRDSVEIKLPAPEQAQTGPQDPHPCRPFDDRKPTEYDAGRINMQRPALLLTHNGNAGHIYLGFGSHQDAPCPMYHGMMVRFDFDSSDPKSKLAQYQTIFQVSKETKPGAHGADNLGKGGIWQAGNGPAADEAGNVYLMTGNGGFEENAQYGSNFVKLDADLKPAAWFAPWNVNLLNADALDIDLGSSGPILVPGSEDVVGGGKQGKIYLLDRTALGGKQKFGWPRAHKDPPIQDFWAARRWQPEFIYGWFPISLFAFATGYHHIHGAPAFWSAPDAQGNLKGSLYIWPERDRVKSFPYEKAAGAAHGKFVTNQVVKGPKAGRGMPGGFLSISANGTNDGILWAALPMRDDAWIDIVRGALRAFAITPDGSTLTPLWTSYCADKEDRFNFGKNVPPTVANGKVYLATFSGFVSVYGARSGVDAPADCKVSEFMMEPSHRKTNQAAHGHH